MKKIHSLRCGLAVVVVALCLTGPRAWPQSEAVGDKTVQVGDSEDSVRERLGKPMGTYRRGTRTVLLYASGEVSVENGKVVDVLRRSASPAAPVRPAPPPPRPPDPPPNPPPPPATNVVPVKAPSPAKPDAGHYPTDPNSRETLVREIPNFGELERDIMSAVTRSGVKATQREVLEQTDAMWRACFIGGGTALAHLRREMAEFDARSAASMPWDPKDEREKANRFKFRRGNNWEYANEPPDSTSTVECWKKRVTGRSAEQQDLSAVVAGPKTEWGKMTWEASRKEWVSTIPSQRAVFLSEYEGKLRQEIADWKSKAANPTTAVETSKDIASLLHTFAAHFRYRYLERFITDYRVVPWPE